MLPDDFNRDTKLQKMLNLVPENIRARPDIDKSEKPKTSFQYSADNVSKQGMNNDLHNPNIFIDENGKFISLSEKYNEPDYKIIPNVKDMAEEMVMNEAHRIPFSETIALGIKWGKFAEELKEYDEKK
jgi:hypothetical protein